MPDQPCPRRAADTDADTDAVASHRADPDGADPDGVDPAVLHARAYLSRVAEPPAPGLSRLATDVGPIEAAERVQSGHVDEQVAGETRERRSVHREAADLAAAAAAGARLVTPEHAEWPAWSLVACAISGADQLAPPLALWVRGSGRLAQLCEHAVAVVGARAATDYGVHVAEALGAGLAGRRHTVVSGAALGVDGAAHRGALAVGGPTLAVLACGVDRPYPMAHEALLEQIAAAGVVLSEYPPGAVPTRTRFLTRNRLIAALSAGTVVIEAGERSGTQRTARDAARLGRLVMAVPVTSGRSAGCHRLIRDGALLVTNTDDVIDALRPDSSAVGRD